MLHPDYLKYKTLYELNDLAFQTKYDIINSNNVQKILPPYPSFLDKRNTKGAENYNRYCMQANYVSFPNICLDAVLGITNIEKPQLNVPKNMESLFDYSTSEGTPINIVQNKIIKSIFKFGLAGLIVEIPENVSIASTTPKIKVIDGNKIIDYAQYVDANGFKQFKTVVVDSSRHLYNEKNKNYSYTKIYKIHGLNFEGRYFIAEILASVYNTFDVNNPKMTDGVISLTFPTWTEELNFVPFTPISKFDTSLKFGPSIVQDLIDISLQNFRLEANLCWLEANAAASHLVIKGRNLDDASQYPVGAGAVHILNDDTANEFYVTPSTQGMAEIKQHIQENTALANELMYNLTNVAANSSGEALKIRLSSKMTDLIGLVRNIGDGITLCLENIDRILNQGINKDVVEYLPYLGFADIENYFTTEKKNIETEKDPQEEEKIEVEDINEEIE